MWTWKIIIWVQLQRRYTNFCITKLVVVSYIQLCMSTGFNSHLRARNTKMNSRCKMLTSRRFKRRSISFLYSRSWKKRLYHSAEKQLSKIKLRYVVQHWIDVVLVRSVPCLYYTLSAFVCNFICRNDQMIWRAVWKR